MACLCCLPNLLPVKTISKIKLKAREYPCTFLCLIMKNQYYLHGACYQACTDDPASTKFFNQKNLEIETVLTLFKSRKNIFSLSNMFSMLVFTSD